MSIDELKELGIELTEPKPATASTSRDPVPPPPPPRPPKPPRLP